MWVMSRMHRRHLGGQFSEGARLLWKNLAKAHMSPEQLTRQLGTSRGSVSRWLYGDRKPELAVANKLSHALGIPTDAWDQVPTRPFEPPAAKDAADERRAELAKPATRRTGSAA